jgi:hypothetical protein
VKIDKRGKPNTCKLCGHQFRFKNKEIKEEWEQGKHICPNCSEPYCNKPNTERILMKLQDEYFDNSRDSSVMEKITKIVISYTESLLKKRYSPYINSYEDVRYYADNTAYYLILEFYNNPDYKIWGSWAGAINGKIRQSLFGNSELPLEMIIYKRLKKKIDQVHSIDYMLDDGHSLVLEDTSTGIGDVDSHMDKILFHNFFVDLLQGFSSRYSIPECMMLIYGVYVQLLNSDTKKVDKFFSSFGRVGKSSFLKFNEIIKKESQILL